MGGAASAGSGLQCLGAVCLGLVGAELPAGLPAGRWMPLVVSPWSQPSSAKPFMALPISFPTPTSV